MARKPRDYDAELQALMNRAKKLKSQKTIQLGELAQVTGGDALPFEALTAAQAREAQEGGGRAGAVVLSPGQSAMAGPGGTLVAQARHLARLVA